MTARGVAALAPMDTAARAMRLRGLLEGAGCDALLVTRLPNVRYLTGFTGSAGMLLVAPTELVLITDGRYQTQSREQLEGSGVDARVEIVSAGAQTSTLGHLVAPFARLGLEAHGVTWAQQRVWVEAFTGTTLVPTEDLVETLRRVKEPGEVARIRAACAIADDALAAMLPTLADVADRAGLRAGARCRHARAGSEREQLRDHRRIGTQRGQAARPSGRAARSSTASWSSSTSDASSTGTAPT